MRRERASRFSSPKRKPEGRNIPRILCTIFVPNQPIRVHVDAGKKMESTSDVPGGLCAILTQQDEKGVWRMCNVANRTLTDTETRYGQTELEALAITWACSDAFYQFLVGAPKFKILTDCKQLVHLFNPKARAPI